MIKHLFNIIFIIWTLWYGCITGYCQVVKDTVIYHEFYFNASDKYITNWNIKDTTKVENLLFEKIDNKGRVSELIFYYKKDFAPFLCYDVNHIIYKYSGKKIITTLYDGTEPMTDCGLPGRSICTINDSNYITKTIYYFYYKQKKKWKKIKDRSNYLDVENIANSIDYYTYSYSKLMGINPISKRFEKYRYQIK